MKYSLFLNYSKLISQEKILGLNEKILLEREGDLSIFYTPFDYINETAKVVLVGITPGPTQMDNAMKVAHKLLHSGASNEDVLFATKQIGAFSGEPMRSNLIKQLNHWGVHKWLSISDSSELFETASNLVHTTSLIRYPVFYQNKPYRGNPNLVKNTLLRKYFLQYFVEEIKLLKDAIFIGLGPTVSESLEWLVSQNIIEKNRVLSGILHPSPNCTYRINYLTGNRNTPTPHATNPEPYDTGRNKFRSEFLNES